MTTLSYEGIDYNVVYIDPSAEINGDGTTYSTAMNVFPSSYTDKTVYLFRRTDETSKISMPKSGNAGLKYVMLLGMPREGQQFYDLLDDAGVKEAWKDETAKYANLLMNSSSYSSSTPYQNYVVYYETSNVMFVANNCYFFRDNDGGSAQSYINFMFYISGGNTKFIECKFGYTQYNLDDDNYLENNTGIDTNTSKYPQYKCGSYAYLICDYTLVEDCVINIVNRSSTYTYPSTDEESSFYFNNAYTFVNNTMINYYCALTDSSSTRGSKLVFNTYNYKLHNIDINIINPRNMMNIIKNRRSQIQYELKNINIHTKGFKNFTPGNIITSEYVIQTNDYYNSSTNYWVHPLIFNVQIDGIYYDYSKEPVKMGNMGIAALGMPYFENGSPKSYVKNIALKFDPDGTSIDNTILYLQSNANNFSSSTDTSSTNYDYCANVGKSFICNNIKVDAIKSNTALVLNGANVKTDEIRGHVELNHATLDVNKIYNDRGSQAGIYSQGNSFLRCKEYEANTNNKDYLYTGQNQVALRYVSNSTTYDRYSDPQHIYIDKTNTVLFDEYVHEKSSNAGNYGLYVCPNYIQNGQFYARNESVFAKTWNVVRTGSTNQASIRFSNNQCKSANWLRIGYEPYKGITINPTTTGNKVLTAYIALKNINENDVINCLNDFELEVRVPYLNADNSVSYDYYPSKSFGWQNDDSTWSNDTELNTFKINIPVEVKDTTNPIEIGFAYRHYDTLGVLYFDTDVKIADKV